MTVMLKRMLHTDDVLLIVWIGLVQPLENLRFLSPGNIPESQLIAREQTSSTHMLS